MEEAPAMILDMDVHCTSCAHIICKSIKRMPGVYGVTAYVKAGTVVVRGSEDIDPAMVERFLRQFADERHYGRRGRHGGRTGVRVITDGGRRPERRPHLDYYMAPAHYYAPPQAPYYANGGRYPYSSAAYNYPHRQHWPAPPPHMAPPHYQYGPGPMWSDGAGPFWSDHNDDDSFCSIM